MTKQETRARVLAALAEGGETTINRIAEATGLSYSQVYRSVKDLAETGEVTEFGQTETGAHLFKLETTEPRRRSTDVDEDESPMEAQTLLPPIGLGRTMKIVGLSLYGDDEMIVELEDGTHRLRAVLIEEES